MKTLVLDAMGVIYSVGDDVGELLCPFIAEKGGLRDAEQINLLYRAASLGQISAKEFWEAVSLNPEFEEEYLRRHSLTDGLLDLLQSVHLHGCPIWCLSNDLSEWSRKLKDRFGLARFVSGFVVSGDVGVRKPDRAIFECLLQRTGTKPEEIVLVDDRIANLDAAAEIGIRTVLFAGDHQNASVKHEVVRNCDELAAALLGSKKQEIG